MAFNIGELQGTITLDASPVDKAVAQAISALQRWQSGGAAAAQRAGQAAGQSYSTSLASGVDTSRAEGAVRSGLAGAGASARAAGSDAGDAYSTGLAGGVDTSRAEGEVRSGLADAGDAARSEGANAGDSYTTGLVGGIDTSRAENEVRSGLNSAGDSAAAAGGEAGDAFTDRMSGGLDKVRDIVSDKLGVAIPAGVGIAAAGGAAIGAGLMLAISAALASDEITRRLQATLGVTAKEAGRYGKLAGDLYAANYGEGMDETADAISAVVKNIQGMGKVSDQVLLKITGQAMSLSAVFGEDITETTRAVSTILQNDLAPNAEAALDVLTKGFQSNVNQADDLLDTFTEYSTIFRSIGIDGKDALGLLSSGLQGGARDADVIADSLKEMLLRIQGGDAKAAIETLGINFPAALANIAKGGESSKATFDLIIDRFNALPQSAEKAGIGVGIFGTKAEDAQKALSALDVSGAADAFESAYGKIDGAASELDTTVGGSLNGAIETFWRKLQGLASEGGQVLLPFLTTAVQGFGYLFDAISAGIGFVQDIPGPLLAIGAAIAVWASWGTIATVVTAVGVALKGLALSAAGAIAALGPIGVILTVATVAMAYFSQTSDGVADSVEAQRTRLEALIGTLDKTTGAITNVTRAEFVRDATASGMNQRLEALGISTKVYTDASLGNVDAQKELARQIEAASTSAQTMNTVFGDLSDELVAANVHTEDLAAATASGDWTGVTQKLQVYADHMAETSGNTQTGTDIMNTFYDRMAAGGDTLGALSGIQQLAQSTAEGLSTAQADAAVSARAMGDEHQSAFESLQATATAAGYSAEQIAAEGKAAGLTAEEIAKIQGAAEDSTVAVDPLVEALTDGGNAADEMNTAITMLQSALDIMSDGSVSAAQAAREHDAAIRAVAQAHRDQLQAVVDAAEAQKEADNVAAHLGTTLDGQAVSATNLAVTQEDVDKATRSAADAAAAATDAADQQADSLDALALSAIAMTARAIENAGGQTNMTGAIAAGRAEMGRQRQAFIDSATAAGVGKEAAEALADAQGLIPDKVDTAYVAINAAGAKNDAQGVESAVKAVPDSKNTLFNALIGNGLSAVEEALNNVARQRTATIVAQAATSAASQALSALTAPLRANGGDLDFAPGPKGVDSALFYGAKGEHVFNDRDVDKLGGQTGTYRFRELLSRSTADAARYLMSMSGEGNTGRNEPTGGTSTAGTGGGSGMSIGKVEINQVGGNIEQGLQRVGQLARAGAWR